MGIDQKAPLGGRIPQSSKAWLWKNLKMKSVTLGRFKNRHRRTVDRELPVGPNKLKQEKERKSSRKDREAAVTLVT